MTQEKRKEYPDIEGFACDGWEIVDDSNIPEFVKDIETAAMEKIKKRGNV